MRFNSVLCRSMDTGPVHITNAQGVSDDIVSGPGSFGGGHGIHGIWVGEDTPFRTQLRLDCRVCSPPAPQRYEDGVPQISQTLRRLSATRPASHLGQLGRIRRQNCCPGIPIGQGRHPICDRLAPSAGCTETVELPLRQQLTTAAIVVATRRRTTSPYDDGSNSSARVLGRYESAHSQSLHHSWRCLSLSQLLPEFAETCWTTSEVLTRYSWGATSRCPSGTANCSASKDNGPLGQTPDHPKAVAPLAFGRRFLGSDRVSIVSLVPPSVLLGPVHPLTTRPIQLVHGLSARHSQSSDA